MKEQSEPVGSVAPQAADVPVSAVAESVFHLEQSGILSSPSRPGLLGQVDRFEIIRVLGRGGMGVVFLARDLEDGRLAALKTLAPEYQNNERVRQKFLTEAGHLRKLKHPHLVPVLEVREFKGGAFFTMPHYEGGSLAERVRPGAPLDAEFILRAGKAVGSALCYAHAKGIIHRDLKPANILLDGRGEPALGDFGLARTLFNDPGIEVDKDQCEGTAPYMSPAVAAGEAEDTRCDIYAFGAVLYHLLTGKPPYTGGSLKEVREKILHEAPETIRKVNPKADPRLALIAETAMARKHSARYANMADLVADLERAAKGDEPLGAHQERRAVHLLRKVPLPVRLAFGLVPVLALGYLLWPKTSLQLVREIKSSVVPSWGAAIAAEWNGLPGKELLVVGNNKMLTFSAEGEFLGRWPIEGQAPGVLHSLRAINPEGEGFDKAIVASGNGWDYALHVVNHAWYELPVKFTARGMTAHARSRPQASEFHYWGCINRSNSNPATLLMAELFSGFRPLTNVLNTEDNVLRALIGYDYRTGERLWTWRIGPSVCSAVTCDLDQDDQFEFAAGGAATANGYAGQDGIWDSNSCVTAISPAGKFLWSTVVGPEFTSARVHPMRFERGKLPGLVVHVVAIPSIHARQGVISPKVVRFDAAGQVIRTYQPKEWLVSVLPMDLNSDSLDELLCTDTQGQVHVLDRDLKCKFKKRFVSAPQPRPGSADEVYNMLVGSGEFEKDKPRGVLVHSYAHRAKAWTNPGRFWEDKDPGYFEGEEIRVLDADLDTIAVRQFENSRNQTGVIKTADLDGDGRDEILYLKETARVLKLK